MFRAMAIALIAGFAFTGCSNDRPKMAGLMVADKGFVSTDGLDRDKGDRNTTIMAWNANNNVALFDGHGQGCFEAAAAFKSQDREAGVSAALPKLLGQGGDIEAVNRVLENVKLLSDKDNAVTFLDTALSNICIIAMNQTNHRVPGAVLNRQDLVDLIKYSIDAAAKVASKQADAKVAAQKPADPETGHQIAIQPVKPGQRPAQPKSPASPKPASDAGRIGG